MDTSSLHTADAFEFLILRPPPLYCWIIGIYRYAWLYVVLRIEPRVLSTLGQAIFLALTQISHDGFHILKSFLHASKAYFYVFV